MKSTNRHARTRLMATNDPFDLKFTSREVTTWGGLVLLKRMLDGLDFKAALRA